MGCMVGYMLSWNTYGTWLQGDRRGWTKNGKVYGERGRLEDANLKAMKGRPVVLDREQREVVQAKIEEVAKRMGQRIYAIAVRSNHVHIVLENTEKAIARAAMQYKMETTLALQKRGLRGKVWARGYDKRFCFDDAAVRARVGYVEGHGE